MDTGPQFNLFLNLLFLVFLTMTNAFFACTEIAMVSINKNKINLLAENGNKTAKLIQKVLAEPTNFLSTIQVAITLSGFFASASAATGFAEILSKRLVAFNLPYTKEISIIIVTITLSYFTLVFGELVPKRIALHKAEAISMFAIRPIYIIAKLTFPFIKLLSVSTNIILRILGFKIDNVEEQVSEEEIKSLLEVGQIHGVFNKTEKDMITSVLSFDNKYAVFVPTWANYGGKDVIVALSKEGNDEKPGTQNVGGSADKQTIAFSGQFNYQNTFNKYHNVSAMLIANGYQQTVSAQYHRISNANLALQAGYNYQQRYYADFGAALIHSAKLAKGHRQALSPSVTLGWRLSGENFLKDSPVVDDLLLSVSGSILNQDIDLVMGDNEFYLYESVWTQNDGYAWYDGPAGKYTISTRGQNDDLSFIKRKEFSVNLKTSLWNRLITADASFFINSMEGYLINQPTFYPSHLNTGYPAASFMAVMNYNNNKRVGFDFNINANKRFGDVDLSLGVAGTYYDTKVTKRDEIYDDAYRYREGKAVDGIWGLQSAGLFQNKEEIESSPEQKLGSTVQPGDIKYVDQNGDNVIDDKDEVFLGKGGWYGAPFTLGINFTTKWKNLTLFVLGTGNFGAYGLKNSSYYWVDGDDKYSAIVRNRWTPETAATATYPRLSARSASNNFRASDYWLYKTDRFDLAKVQITYDLPKRILRNTFINELSAYVSGANLLTISKERKHMEMNVGSAPQSRFYNIGVKAVF